MARKVIKVSQAIAVSCLNFVWQCSLLSQFCMLSQSLLTACACQCSCQVLC